MADWRRRGSQKMEQHHHRRRRHQHQQQQKVSGFYHHGGGGGGGDGRSSSGGGGRRGERSKWCNPKYGVPPLPGSWQQPSFPSWEKEFCYMAGVPWRKLCEAKRLLPSYRSIKQWDDSAAKEAFQNAKARFWSEINSLHSDLPLPDPDMYIEEIDWDARIDPELLPDLDNEPTHPLPDDKGKDGKSVCLESIWDSSLSVDKHILSSGWGNVDYPIPSWRDDGGINSWDNSWGNNGNSWGQWPNSPSKDRKDHAMEHMDSWKRDVDDFYYSQTRRSGIKRQGNGKGWYNSRIAEDKARDSHQRNNNATWADYRGKKRAHHADEQAFDNKRPSAPMHRNSLQSCGPANRQDGWPAWHFEKRVS